MRPADPTTTHRWATAADAPALRALIHRSVEGLLPAFLNPAQVQASRRLMGLDTQLIADGTYAVLEQDGVIVACGGWSWRATLYGGDDSAVVREARRLDPATEAAKVRAMYVSPDHPRQGLGRRLLTLVEAAARDAGYRRVELMATLPGVPLYRACGYSAGEPVAVAVPGEAEPVPLLPMHKAL